VPDSLLEGFLGVCLEDCVDGSDPLGPRGTGGKGLCKTEEHIF